MLTANGYVSGVRWSGLQSEPDHVFPAYDFNAPEEVAKRTAFAESSKGRLLAAIREIERAQPNTGSTLYGMWCRSVQASDLPMSREVGGAFVAILSGLLDGDGADAAKAGLEAVSELLMSRVA